MSRSKKNKVAANNNGGAKMVTKKRKMKPYCLTGDKKVIPAFIDQNTSYENYDNIGDAKKERADIKIEKKAEKHRVRQQAKNKLRKDLDNL